MKAEAAMWLGDATTARDLMEIGMQHSFNKVLGFGALDANADPNFIATQAEVDDFIASILAQFDNAPSLDTSLDTSTLNDNFGYL